MFTTENGWNNCLWAQRLWICLIWSAWFTCICFFVEIRAHFPLKTKWSIGRPISGIELKSKALQTTITTHLYSMSTSNKLPLVGWIVCTCLATSSTKTQNWGEFNLNVDGAISISHCSIWRWRGQAKNAQRWLKNDIIVNTDHVYAITFVRKWSFSIKTA